MGKWEQSIEKDRIILVEGKDEDKLVMALLENMGLHDFVQVIDVDGKGNIVRTLQMVLNARDETNVVRLLGIIRDADGHKRQTFEGLTGALKQKNLPAPTQNGALSTLMDGLKIGIFIMPGELEGEMLEDLVFNAIPDKDKECVNAFLDCAGVSKEIGVDFPKRRLNAFFLTQPKWGSNVADGVKHGYWDYQHPCFKELTDFLEHFRPEKD